MIGQLRASLVDFWSRVRCRNRDTDSCWDWIGAFDSHGYPLYCGVYARRIAALIDTREIPGNVSMGGLDCGQTCIRPSHIARIGAPGRKNQNGYIPVRQDVELQRAIFHLRFHSDAEIARKLGVKPCTVLAARNSFALLAIEQELLQAKASKRVPHNAPLAPLFDLIK
jgi:hypothetical protein